MAFRLMHRATMRVLAKTRFLAPHHRCISDRSQQKQLPPWINLPEIYQPPPPDITESLKADSSTLKDYGTVLRVEFERDAKAFLISHCVLVPSNIGVPDVKQIYFMIKKIIGHIPYYATSCTVARLLYNHNNHWREHVLKSIAEEKVMVLEDWENELASFELFMPEHGLQFAPVWCS